mgnify:CR=1 FL=1
MKLSFENISKLYGDTVALQQIDLTLGSGVYGLLGPNGAGKTTLMRIMTDLLAPSTGRVLLDGQDIAVMGAAFRKKLGYLPQDFGVYPNFTAEQFLLYIARLKGLSKFEAKRQTDELLRMVGLEDKKQKKLKGFSGGQRQRVALGRAMVRDPAVFLLDEPLSNLDAKLRTEMRARIAELHRELGTTFVYVTHDQTEAMTMADRIVVMLDGKIQQADTPAQLYAHPCNVFVAGFIGTPPMNILPGRLVRRGNALDLQVLGTEVALPHRLQSHAKLLTYVDRDVLLGLRAEDLSTDPAWLNITDPAAFRVQVEMAERMGAETYLYADLQGRRVIARVPGTVSFQKEDQTVLYPNMEALHLFDPETEVCICD